MRTFKLFTILLILSMISLSSYAQLFTVSGQVGYAGPRGNAFTDDVTGDRLSSFGLGYEADVMMCLDKLDNKLAVGLMYSGAALIGSEGESFFDFGVYGLALYGIKGQYRLLNPDKSFSPYGSLGLGLSQMSTPDVTVGTDVTKGGRAYSLGLRPEIGLDLGGFLISASYFVPMKYKIESPTGDFDGTAGAFNISIGYRHYMDLTGIF
ncbi:MAG: outer membrane beta-barrel protein [Bacteroidetes bacterium]|nr:outer membrane beta-barrel protein [Bacteroidota bacterium]